MKITRNEAFVLYRLPHDDKTFLIKTDKPVSWPHKPDSDIISLKGFLFYPHLPDKQNPVWHLPSSQIHQLDESALNELQIDFELQQAPELHITSKDQYQQQVKHIQKNIADNRIKKAILSRIEAQDMDVKPLEWYKKLCNRYPQVMVMWIHIPGQVSWMTATPEILLSYRDKQLHTMSLAGTQADKGQDIESVTWGDKEQQEQAIVTDYARDLLNHHFGCPVKEDGPQTISTGKLLHLQTDFKLQVNDPSTLTGFLYDFHPTPAISGFPKQEALQVIAETESHDRGYYTGFLGPVNIEDKTSLFVNLRCMQLFKNKVALYLGGGITNGSIASDEWQETQIKAQTLLDVIN